MSLLRNFVFTWNNPGTEWQEQLVEALELPELGSTSVENSLVVFLVTQLECPSGGTEHLQGYVELRKRTRFATISGLIPTWHVEARRGTQAQALHYVVKQETRVSGPWDWGKPRTQGERTDLAVALTALKSGQRLQDLLMEEETAVTVMRYPKGIAVASTFFTKIRTAAWRNVVVHVVVGSTGMGKSRSVLYSAEGTRRPVYIVSPPSGSTLWFDGYMGEKEILIDEFYGWIKYSWLLRLLDGHQVRLPTKGGFDYAEWTTVWITSNKRPEEWYSTGLTPALGRRLATGNYTVDREPEELDVFEG